MGLGGAPDHLKEVVQGMGEGFVDQLVADLPTTGVRAHESAVAQAGEVVRNVLSSEPEPVGEPGGVVGSFQEGQQQTAPGGVGQRASKALDRG